MELKSVIFSWNTASYAELSADDQQLCEAARAMCMSSYAPYSRFHVGAAARLANGYIVQGSNQENAAYPSGLCAERCALFAAGAQHSGEAVMALAIAACDDQGVFTSSPITPCGACRQVMLEAEQRYGHAIRVLLCGATQVHVVDSCRALLPLQFDAAML